MPSFSGLIRLGVLYVTVVLAVLTSASKGAGVMDHGSIKEPPGKKKGEKPRCEFGLAAGRPGRMPPWRPLSASPMTRFGVPARFVVMEDIETDSHRKAGHLNRPQCKVMLA